jgi:hypothetical protein
MIPELTGAVPEIPVSDIMRYLANMRTVLLIAVVVATVSAVGAQPSLAPAVPFELMAWQMAPASVAAALAAGGFAHRSRIARGRDSVDRYHGTVFGRSAFVTPSYNRTGGLQQLTVEFEVDSTAYAELYAATWDSLVARHGVPHTSHTIIEASKYHLWPTAMWGSMRSNRVFLHGAWPGRKPSVGFSYDGPNAEYIARVEQERAEKPDTPEDRVYGNWELTSRATLLECRSRATSRYFQGTVRAEFEITPVGLVLPWIVVSDSRAQRIVEDYLSDCRFIAARVGYHSVRSRASMDIRITPP